nr:hypothetical protein [Pseudotabrizicola formosa]
MKFNARCWTLPAVVPLIVMLWLTGCGTDSFKALVPCPPVVEYSADDQDRAAKELETLPEGAVVVIMLNDYAVMRDQARACR